MESKEAMDKKKLERCVWKLAEWKPEAWLVAKRSDVTGEKAAWVYVQGPDFVGFGVATDQGLQWPEGSSLAGERIEEIRLFGERGEWRIWKRWDAVSWEGRRRLAEEDEKEESFSLDYLLWGRGVKKGAHVALSEERGATILFPKRPSLDALRESDLPLRVVVKQFVDFQRDTGLAGVVDVRWEKIQTCAGVLLRP